MDSGEEILEGLSERQKDILRLAKVEEMPLAEIAVRQGMSLSAVKVTIHRSVQAIRKNFRKE
jgi:RNA polymerase sigma-70 factor (ECF subfamily)